MQISRASQKCTVWKEGSTLRRATSFAMPLVWLIVAGSGIWHYAGLEREPPVFDALSYAQKAQAFWHAVASRHFFNPLNIQPDIRPFGTVFFTYPFGFDYTFRSFYFLTNFLPMVFIYLSIYNIFRPLREKTDAQIFAFAVLLIATTALPPVFQFALAPNVDVMGAWGYVDLIFGTLAGLSVSFLVRANRDTYFFDVLCAAVVATITIFVKPTGMVVMAAIYGAAVVISAVRVKHGEITIRKAAYALISITVLFTVVAAILYNSAYFSAANIAYGESSLRLLHQTSRGLGQWREVISKVWVSFGPVFIAVLIVGFLAASSRKSWHLAALAALAVAGGFYLWMGRTNVDVVRYFFPFPVMAIMFVMPGVLRVTPPRTYAGCIVLSLGLLPALLIVLCLYNPAKFQRLETALGINLSVNVNSSAVAEADALSQAIGRSAKRSFVVYYVGGSSTIRGFEAVMDWKRVLGLAGGNSIPALPVDWKRESAYRFNEMIRADFIVFQPVFDAASYLKEHRSAANYDEEEMLIRAWLSTLEPSNGVLQWGKGVTEVLEVRDRVRLWDAMAQLANDRKWPPAFADGLVGYGVVDSNRLPPLRKNLVPKAIELFDGDVHVASILAVTRNSAGGDDRYSVYVRQLSEPSEPAGPWTVFIHRMESNGQFTGGYRSYFSQSADANRIVIYSISMKQAEKSSGDTLAVGIYMPIDSKHARNLINPGKDTDWDGKRTIIQVSQGIH